MLKEELNHFKRVVLR